MGLSIDETGRVTVHPICKPVGSGLGGNINGSFRDARAWRQPVDPLMLDLDGDGLELKRASGSILFDHNADTIRTGTGWLGADDGILVRDLNANGSIDSGRELFGIDTIKFSGKNAVNGFDALGDLDSNADGQLNAADLAWGSLQVWRDLDQDGMSDTGELFNLDALGISRIGVNGSATNTTGGAQAGTTVNGNFIAQSASFTRDVDGRQVDRSVGAVDLEANPFYREFTAPVTLSEQARSLPDMQGSGRTRDLAEAVSLSPSLGVSLVAFSSATTRDTQRALLDNLLTQWAQGSDFWQSLETTLDGNVTISGLPAGMNEAQYRDLVGVLEVFNGERFYSTGANGMPLTAGTTRTNTTDTATNITRAGYGIAPPAAQITLLQQSYDALKESVYGALVLQTRLRPYLDAIELTIDENGIRFDTTALGALLDQRKAGNEREALLDLVELNRFAQPTLQAVGFAGLDELRGWVEALPAGAALRTELAALNVYVGPTTNGSGKNDIYLGDANDNSFTGGAGDDMADAGAGHDTLHGGDGNDNLFGGAGNDSLNGEAGDDTLDGGSGNDTLSGGLGNNVYRFGRGDGQDLIRVYDASAGKSGVLEFKEGVSPGDIVARQVYDSFYGGNMLELGIAGTTDKVSISGFFVWDSVTNPYNPVQQVKFADGTVWDTAAMLDRLYAGTDGNDALTGTSSKDTVFGGHGSDTLIGGGGNDRLSGGAGNDTLNGSAGDDSLDGGAGNDSLDGGTGSDTYLFGRGDGQDLIRVYDSSAGKTGVLEFKEGISPSDIVARQVYDSFYGGNMLELGIAGTTDKVSISGFFVWDSVTNPYNPVQQVRFADGTVWDTAAMLTRLYAGTDGNDSLVGTNGNDTMSGGLEDDTLNGGAGNDTLNGGAGNDTVYGQAGNDVLDGGGGNDFLDGGSGSNVYRFGRGDGQDLIRVYDSSAGKTGVLEFKEDVSPSDIVARQVYDSFYGGNMLELGIAGTTDKVSISGFFVWDDVTNPYNPVQQVRFADGTVWNTAAMLDRLYAGTDGNDSVIGTSSNDTMFGRLANDTLSGGAGDDTLDAGAGNDTVYGQAGNDILDGGSGDDFLDGGTGNNVYQFGRGDGQDLIRVYDSSAGKTGVLEFKEGVSPSDIVARQVYDSFYGGNMLELGIAGTTDKVSISGFFVWDDVTNPYNPVQQVKFADGTAWDLAAIQARLFAGTADAETLTGANSTDTIHGQAGADILYGRDGSDSLHGGAGNDALYGEGGNDTLDGGAGDDTLMGGSGNDIYVIERGSGQDSISDHDTTAGNADAMHFSSDVHADQLWFRRVGTDLEVSIIGTNDKATIGNWYSGSASHVEQFKTSDGKMLLDSQVDALVAAMAAFAPPAAGQISLPNDYQTALSTVIAANWK